MFSSRTVPYTLAKAVFMIVHKKQQGEHLSKLSLLFDIII